ncbi:MAG: hypothetical protein PHF31_02795 [Methylobacter sp.]|nr:hypothetical protein [Methylobacter sp.]
MTKSIALLGEYMPTFPPHISIDAVIRHAKNLLDMELTANWVSTEDIDLKLFDHYSGIWIAPGSPYKSMEKPPCGPFAMPGKTEFPALAPVEVFSIW